MSWLNFNDSLNNLKGQISTFASNVLADEDEGPDIKNSDYEELKKMCVQQEIEIKNLRRINEHLNETSVQRNETNHINHSNEHWNWEEKEQNPAKESNKFISDLREQVHDLENERKELLGQLEQLDLENQQNLAKIVGMKEKLQEENSDLQENCAKLKQQNKNITNREEKLKKELKELQHKFKQVHETSAHSLTGDGYREKYERLLQENQTNKSDLEGSQMELNVLKNSNITLQKILEDCNAANEEETTTIIEKLKRLEGENKIMYAELQKAKEAVKDYEKKSLEDADNCQKLAFILESYEKQVSTLKQDLEEVKLQNEKLQLNDTSNKNEEIVEKLRNELENISENHDKDVSSLKAELSKLKLDNNDLQLKANGSVGDEKLKNLTKELEVKIRSLTEEVNSLRLQNEKLLITANSTNNEDNLRIEALENLNEQQEMNIAALNDELARLNVKNENLGLLAKELEDLKKGHEETLLQSHKKYVNILTENVKKFQECDKPSDFQHCCYEDDPQVADFSKQVENILKILLDYKCKCEALENKVYDLSQEKTNILTEKNHEIEKLMQNSEILSQEVITKTETIKEVENEVTELGKNNELLINELESYKNNSGLQTISESNEDNLIILESQLENANKRIEDLEKIIDDLEKQKDESKLETEDYTLRDAITQLNVTEEEISSKEKDYQELLNSFDQLHIEYDSLKLDLEASKEDLNFSIQENEELKSSLEKATVEYENAEYQVTEVNINVDSLKEELEGYKIKIDILIKENEKLQMLHEESMKTNEDIRTELNIVREKLLLEEDGRKNLEVQIRNMTEKLQHAKMAETSLKLQYDTISKEILALSETKHTLEVSLNKTNVDLAQFQNNFLEIQLQNDKLCEEHETLKKIILQRESQITNFEKLVGELQTKLQEYEKLNENKHLLKKISISENGDKEVEELQIIKLEKYEDLGVSEMEHEPGNIKVDVKKNGEYEELKMQCSVVVEEKKNLQMELNKVMQLQAHFTETLEKNIVLQQQLQEISTSRNELINIVTTKHQESIAYHNEIQRLSQFLAIETDKCKNLELQLSQLQNTLISSEEVDAKNQEIEKLTDQNTFLKEKCEVMAKNLLEEQSKLLKMIAERSSPSEKELSLQKKLDRLQAHLIELEEHYTQELLQAEQKNGELQTKLQEIVEREKSSSTMYTSVSIRANQQVESLQSQLQVIVNERDGLRNQISDAEDLNTKQAAALANLQFVLEQFRRDKEKDVQKETERIRRQINVEKQTQEELKKEISNLKTQLDESKQGLQAASRLSDQLEYSKKTVTTLKEEVSQLQEKLIKCEEELKNTTSQTDGKVDKSLIKNLVIGFVSSNNNLNKDQTQILKIIATVLDFNQQDHDKVNLNKTQHGSWLSFLAPQPGSQNMSQESLSQAFIKFLENESKPRVVPSLLNAASEPTKSTNTSKSTTPRQSPIVLSEIVLPTFADFGQNRNSSSILKDVLKDNS